MNQNHCKARTESDGSRAGFIPFGVPSAPADDLTYQIQVVERKLSRHDKQLGWRRKGHIRLDHGQTDRAQNVDGPKKAWNEPKEME